MENNTSFFISYKQHLLIGLLAGLWLTLFLVFVGPYDTATLSLEWRAQVMYVYGLVFFISYAATIPVQLWLQHNQKRSRILQEVVVFLIVFLLTLPGSYLYYKSETINGDFDFYTFCLQVFLPTIVIFFPLLFIARWFVFRLAPIIKDYTGKQDIDNEKIKSYWKPKIEKLMAQKVYLDADLTLNKMARLLDTNSSVLSKVINQGYGTNFNDFVNSYRIEAVLQSIEQGQHKQHTFLGISQNCGFRSKATFNRAFKKTLNVSPSEYVRERNLK